MKKSDPDTSIAELKAAVAKFREERGWRKHHTPKNLAISIALEAAELLEHYQWDEYHEDDKQAQAEELIDVIFNCLNLADVLEVDVTSTFYKKLAKAEKKYPTTLFNPEKDSHDDYFRIKKEYRQGKNKT